jgi:RimJ/RimL family protein N-acetyltransferase
MPTPLSGTIQLVPLKMSDAPEMTRLLQEASITDQLVSVHSPYHLENAQAWIERCQAFDFEAGRVSQWGIHWDGQLVGEIGFHSWKPQLKTQSSLGFWIGKPYQGRGIATESILQVTAIGFDTYKLALIKAAVFEGNTTSRQVLENCGFRYKSLQKNYFQKANQQISCWLFEKGAEPS